jgi:uncharacterized protein involved in response to NO
MVTSRAASHRRLVPFAYGFRPFFAAALGYAMISLIGWLAIRTFRGLPISTLPPQLWHAHEMLFGFIVAAIAGFLLTAVPSWTGTRGFAGWPLIALTLLWLAGRITFALSAHISPELLSLVELAFLPALALIIAPPLLRTRNRNTALLLVLGALWLTDGTFLCAMSLGDVPLASHTIRVGIDIVLLLITVIGGRIVPAFTGNALRSKGVTAPIRSSVWLEALVIGAMVAFVIADATNPAERSTAVIAGVAAIAHLVRMSGWQGYRAARQPIVWVLHVAYFWLPLGLALKAVDMLFAPVWAAQWLHVLTIGAASTMVVAVISRAALGHTGRPLRVDRRTAIAYGLLTAATLVRALGDAGLPYEASVWIAGGLWISAFALLLATYLPVLLRPRVDGRPG